MPFSSQEAEIMTIYAHKKPVISTHKKPVI